MSLFFYGAIEICESREEVSEFVLKLASQLNWHLQIDKLQEEASFSQLFNIQDSFRKDFLVFELKGHITDIDTELYANFGGEQMTQYYRTLASKLEISDAATLGFGDLDVVTDLYRVTFPNLPVIKFMQILLDKYKDNCLIFCFDEGFENRFSCREVVGDSGKLLQEAWLTIAFGYSWPNLRLRTL